MTLVEALKFKDQTEDDVINNFMNQSPKPENLKCQMMKTVLEHEDQEDPVMDFKTQHISTTTVRSNIPIEIELGKVLNINGSLYDNQKQKLIQVLQKHQGAFSWDYQYMKGLDPQLCTHHIYTDRETHHVRQLQQRLNPHLK